jgi:hypothetical protein
VSLNTSLNIATLINPQWLAWAKVASEASLVMLSVPAALWAGARELLKRVEKNETAALVMAANEAAQIRAEQAAERAAIRAEKRSNLQSKPVQVAQVPEPAPQVANKQPRKHIDLAKLAQVLEDKPDATNDELGKMFDVSGEAARLARKKLPGATEALPNDRIGMDRRRP